MAQVSEPLAEEGTPGDRTSATSDSPAPGSPAPSPLTTHSVLDARLEALALGHNDLASLLLSSKDGATPDFSLFKRKGPNSIPGTGSSIASASDHEVSSSDFESDSGIENSHAEVHSPEMSVVPVASKGVEPSFLEVMPHDDLAVVQAAASEESSQSDAGEKSCDLRIESFIQCLDTKVDKETLTKEALELLRLIPDGYIPLPHQVGGHRHVDGKLGFLRRVGQRDILFKPVPAQKGPREVLFYKKVFGVHFSEQPKELIALKELVPKYYGTHDIIDRAGKIHKFLKLEDIVSRFHKPCIIDVKIGRRVWDDFAQQDKIERERKKYPQQEIIGFRIIGMRVYRSAIDDYVYYDKEYGRSVPVSGAQDALNQFFMDGETKRSDVIGPIIERLYYFLRWMEQQKLFKLFATSLIIVYEGDTKRPIRKPKDLLDIRLVDFAHAYERDPDDPSEPDFNMLFGLQNFIRYLQQLNVTDHKA